MKQTFKIPDGCKEVTIEQVGDQIVTTFDPEKSKEKWRANLAREYYFMSEFFEVRIAPELNFKIDDLRFKNGNYHKTKGQAEQYRDFMLKKSLEFNTNNK